MISTHLRFFRIVSACAAYGCVRLRASLAGKPNLSASARPETGRRISTYLIFPHRLGLCGVRLSTTPRLACEKTESERFCSPRNGTMISTYLVFPHRLGLCGVRLSTTPRLACEKTESERFCSPRKGRRISTYLVFPHRLGLCGVRLRNFVRNRVCAQERGGGESRKH